ARPEQDRMIVSQLDELNATKSIVNFERGHEKRTRFLKKRDAPIRRRVGPVDAARSPERLLRNDLEIIAAALGHDAEPRHGNLGGTPALMTYLELGESCLHFGRVELKQYAFADLDPRLLQEPDVGCLAAATLPEEVEPMVIAADSQPRV